MGIFNSTFRVNRVFRFTSLGRTSEYWGTSSTSSKVKALYLIRIQRLLFWKKVEKLYQSLQKGETGEMVWGKEGKKKEN
jgi:hypothetical protein